MCKCAGQGVQGVEGVGVRCGARVRVVGGVRVVCCVQTGVGGVKNKCSWLCAGR